MTENLECREFCNMVRLTQDVTHGKLYQKSISYLHQNKGKVPYFKCIFESDYL